MNDTLYLQTDQNIEVHHPHVYLQDIAGLSCTNPNLLNRLRVLPVCNLPPDRPGRYVMSVIYIINQIQKKEPSLTITHLGEPDFILTYEKAAPQSLLLRFCKAALVCLASFFGAGFSIMTFNADADVGKLFGQIYQQVTGSPSDGFTILEIAYSVGLFLGVLFFFNHFSKVRITSDPSPMQVQMRTYEDQINHTIIEDSSRPQALSKAQPPS